jgi:hypothetical protein
VQPRPFGSQKHREGGDEEPYDEPAHSSDCTAPDLLINASKWLRYAAVFLLASQTVGANVKLSASDIQEHGERHGELATDPFLSRLLGGGHAGDFGSRQARAPALRSLRPPARESFPGREDLHLLEAVTRAHVAPLRSERPRAEDGKRPLAALFSALGAAERADEFLPG